MSLPEVVEGNAHITAEATVAEILKYGQYSIRGQKMVVTGYGACGEKIAKLLLAMGAEVTIVARREEVRAQAEADGCRAVHFSKLPEVVKEAKTIINTVPAEVVTAAVIENMSKDAMIVDIASAPGGTDFEAAKKAGIPAYLSLGLPGIYTTTSSATLMRDAITTYAPYEEDARKDRQWIFQIFM
jgi:dipicolinate synthase subunit A